jgi:hypothetical protein
LPPRPDQVLVGTHLDAALAARFRDWARRRDGSASAALRRLVAEAVDAEGPPPPRGAGRGRQVGVRLGEDERRALAEAAAARGTTPANWLRSLALAHLARRPTWSADELAALRDGFGALRRLAAALEAGARAPGGAAADDPAAEVRAAMRWVAALVRGNLEGWGAGPDAAGAGDAPPPARGGGR